MKTEFSLVEEQQMTTLPFVKIVFFLSLFYVLSSTPRVTSGRHIVSKDIQSFS